MTSMLLPDKSIFTPKKKKQVYFLFLCIFWFISHTFSEPLQKICDLCTDGLIYMPFIVSFRFSGGYRKNKPIPFSTK